MNKIIVGILPQCNLKFEEDPYQDRYVVINNYPKRIMEQGAIPIALLMNDGALDEDVLNICDAFLLPGGRRIEKTQFQILEHAIKNNKPVLGICCGMQSMAIYSMLKERLVSDRLESINFEDICNKFDALKKENYIFLKKLETDGVHGEYVTNNEFIPSISNISKFTHQVNINDNSILYDVYKKNSIEVQSLHRYLVFEYGNLFNVTAYADDNVIEGLEYKDKEYFIVGVQFHPEILPNNPLIKRFIEEAKKRKNNN